MPSRQIQRLRSMHKDLQALYNGYTGAAGQHRKAIRELGINAGPSLTALQRQHSNATSQLDALRKEATKAVEDIRAKANKSKVAPTEATKTDVREMLRDGLSTQQVCQWLLTQRLPDGFAALYYLLGQASFKQDNPEQWLSEQSQVVQAYEKQVMDATQLEALDEAREVENCQQWLLGDFDRMDQFFANQADPVNGGLRQLTKLSKWAGIPGQHEGNSAELLADGIDVPLANNAVS